MSSDNETKWGRARYLRPWRLELLLLSGVILCGACVLLAFYFGDPQRPLADCPELPQLFTPIREPIDISNSDPNRLQPLEESIIDAIMADKDLTVQTGNISSGQALVAHVSSTRSNAVPLRAWRTINGQITPEDPARFQKRTRNQSGPRVFWFTITALTPGSACVVVWTSYLYATGAGWGAGYLWRLDEVLSHWFVIGKMLYYQYVSDPPFPVRVTPTSN